MIDIIAGQVFRKVYPFKHWEDEWSSGWAGGCHSDTEDGPEIYGSYCEQNEYYTADGEGEIEYEVLAYVEMPRKIQVRVIYMVTMITPEGDRKKSGKCHTVTEAKFRRWIEAGHSSYPFEYEVIKQ